MKQAVKMAQTSSAGEKKGKEIKQEQEEKMQKFDYQPI